MTGPKRGPDVMNDKHFLELEADCWFGGTIIFNMNCANEETEKVVQSQASATLF